MGKPRKQCDNLATIKIRLVRTFKLCLPDQPVLGVSDNREETQRDVTRKNNEGVKWEVLPDFYGDYGMDPIFVKVDVIPAPFKAAF